MRLMKKQTIEEIEKEREQLAAEVREALATEDEEKLIRIRAKQDIIPVKLYRAKIEKAKCSLAEAESERKALERETENAGVQIEEARKERDRLEKAFKDGDKAVDEVSSHISRLSTRKYHIAHQIRDLSSNLNALETELSKLIGGAE